MSSGSKSAATEKLEAEKALRAQLEVEQAKQVQVLMHDHAKELAKLKDEKTREISRMKESHSAELDRLHGAMSQALSNTRAQLREKFASTSAAADKVHLNNCTSDLIHTRERSSTVPRRRRRRYRPRPGPHLLVLAHGLPCAARSAACTTLRVNRTRAAHCSAVVASLGHWSAVCRLWPNGPWGTDFARIHSTSI